LIYVAILLSQRLELAHRFLKKHVDLQYTALLFRTLFIMSNILQQTLENFASTNPGIKWLRKEV
jgi:hypothetical protein